MRRKFSRVIFVCLLLMSAAIGRPVSGEVNFTTPPAAVSGWITKDSDRVLELEAMAAFTLTGALPDDTVTGNLILTISDQTRLKISELAGRDPGTIPATTILEGINAGFDKQTYCPNMRLVINDLETGDSPVKMKFDRIVIMIPDSVEQIPQLLCAWTRQINAGKPRLGIIAALNRLLAK